MMVELRCPHCGFPHDQLVEVVQVGNPLVIRPSWHDDDPFPYTVTRRKFNALCPKTLDPLHLIIEEYTDDQEKDHKEFHLFKGVLKT